MPEMSADLGVPPDADRAAHLGVGRDGDRHEHSARPGDDPLRPAARRRRLARRVRGRQPRHGARARLRVRAGDARRGGRRPRRSSGRWSSCTPSSLLAPSHLGRGLAIVTAGGTAAAVAGLPAATLLAQTLGWRATFVVLGSIAVLLGVIVVRGMPRYLPERAPTASAQPDPARTRRCRRWPRSAGGDPHRGRAVHLVHLHPAVSRGVGVDRADWAAGLLFVYGAAGMVGVVAAGFLADRFPRSSLAAIPVLFAVALLVLAVAAGTPWAVVAGLAAWGFAIGAIFPLLQTTLMRVVHRAHAHPRERRHRGALQRRHRRRPVARRACWEARRHPPSTWPSRHPPCSSRRFSPWSGSCWTGAGAPPRAPRRAPGAPSGVAFARQ